MMKPATSPSPAATHARPDDSELAAIRGGHIITTTAPAVDARLPARRVLAPRTRRVKLTGRRRENATAASPWTSWRLPGKWRAAGPGGGGQRLGRLPYRRRNGVSSALVPTFHMLSATLIVTPGGTIWSMRSSTSVDNSIPSAAR